jgi:hypothetical protein
MREHHTVIGLCQDLLLVVVCVAEIFVRCRPRSGALVEVGATHCK